MIFEQLAGLLNRNVAMSSQAQDLVRRLEGRSLAVHVEGVPLEVTATIHSGQLSLTSTSGGAADATVSGTPLTLLSLLGADARTRLRSSAVTVNGNAEVAESFQELLRAARPDFEEELSRHIGDVAAHQVGNVLRGLAGWGSKAAQTFAANVGEYLQEEGRDLVTRTEMDEFLAEVDQLREAADRLEARITRLAGRAKR